MINLGVLFKSLLLVYWRWFDFSTKHVFAMIYDQPTKNRYVSSAGSLITVLKELEVEPSQS